MPANERQRVAAARVGEGDAGVARRREPGRHAGHDLERDALLVEEQRLGAAAVEDERVAPFEPGDRLALARFFREQIADRLLLERLRRGHAHVDFFGISPRVPEQTRMHEPVVQHHVGGRETLQAADGDEARIARPRADQINHARHRSR